MEPIEVIVETLREQGFDEDSLHTAAVELLAKGCRTSTIAYVRHRAIWRYRDQQQWTRQHRQYSEFNRPMIFSSSEPTDNDERWDEHWQKIASIVATMPEKQQWLFQWLISSREDRTLLEEESPYPSRGALHTAASRLRALLSARLLDLEEQRGSPPSNC